MTMSVERRLQAMQREFVSLLRGNIELLDEVEKWCRASKGEDQRLTRLAEQWHRMLLMHAVRPTAHLGQPIDLRYHAVVATEPRADAAEETVIDILQSGYEALSAGLEPVVLRPARVVMGVAPRQAETANTSLGEDHVKHQ